MDDEDKRALRVGVAQEYEIALYRSYGEAEAAHYIDVDISTLKRWRRKGLTPYVNMGERQIRYLGYQIADIILFGTGWDRTPDGPGEESPPPPPPGKPMPEQALEAARSAVRRKPK